MTARAALVALALVTAACGSGESTASEASSDGPVPGGPVRGGPVRGGPARDRVVVPPGQPASGRPALGPPDLEAEALREAARTPSPWGAGPIEITETETVTEAPPPRPRDLGAELRAAIGTPSHCLDVETARSLGGSLRATVRAYVSETGRVTRAEVSSTAPESVRVCIARVAEGVALVGPIEDAPRAVATEVAFDVRVDSPAPAEAADPVPPAPAGTTGPGIVVPPRPPLFAD